MNLDPVIELMHAIYLPLVTLSTRDISFANPVELYSRLRLFYFRWSLRGS